MTPTLAVISRTDADLVTFECEHRTIKLGWQASTDAASLDALMRRVMKMRDCECPMVRYEHHWLDVDEARSDYEQSLRDIEQSRGPIEAVLHIRRNIKRISDGCQHCQIAGYVEAIDRSIPRYTQLESHVIHQDGCPRIGASEANA